VCSIFGFVLDKELSDSDIETGKAHSLMMKHRGPDASGFWFDKKNGIFLGHNRLSIIDLRERSNQPIHSNNRVTIFNGEIYNFKEIRASLEKFGHIFKTSGDSEVLSLFLEQHHLNYLENLDGMFAFASYNFKKCKLELAVDAFAEKPLYYIKNKEGFYFSSEIKPLVTMLNLKLDLDQEKQAEFISLGYFTNGKTAWKGLYKLQPAESLSYDLKNHTKLLKRYWNIPAIDFSSSRDCTPSESEIDEIHNVLIDSLKLRARADVPMGIFLSSGIDSSLIASILKKDLDLDFLALTARFDSNMIHDESMRAKLIADFLGIEHIIVDTEQDKDPQDPNSLFNYYFDLNDNATAISVNQLSKLGRPYFKVAMTGTGGDELFLGYNKHEFIFRYQSLLSNSTMKKIIVMLNFFNFIGNARLKTASYLSAFNGLEIIYALKNFPYYKQGEFIDLFPKKKIKSNIKGSLIEQYIHFDLSQNLPQSIIPAIDLGSMRQGMEVRTPFLSKELYAAVSKVNGRSLLHSGSKGILKSILKRYLPDELVTDKKLGFVFPMQKLVKIPKQLADKDFLFPSNQEKHFSRLFLRLELLDLINSIGLD